MQTTQVTGAVLAFAVAFALISGSGVGATIFGQTPADSETTRTLDDLSNRATEPIGADVAGDNEPTIVGFVLAGGDFIVELVGAVAVLPVTLTRLGFPNYFAVPVGGVAQIIATIGFFQFVTGNEYL